MNFSIGLSGLQVAQRAIEVVGTNIANASTEGYHRQDIMIDPLAVGGSQNLSIGGATIRQYRRAIDSMLESEIRRQRPQYGQVNQELLTLRAFQGSLGTLDANGLVSAMSRFFGALRELAADPLSQPLREQAVWMADSLAGQFRQIGAVINGLREQLIVEAANTIEEANALTERIASLNGQIAAVSMRGSSPGLLLDQRDQAIVELADLTDLDVRERTDGSGIVDVVAWGTTVVLGNHSTDFATTIADDGDLALSIEGAVGPRTDVRGGRLGGLVALHNELLADIAGDLDRLAGTIIDEVNRLHVQGVGTAGSFEELTGSMIAGAADATLDSWSDAIAAGTLHVRVVDPDGSATSYSIDVDPATDTLNTIAAKLGALDAAHLTASVVNRRLHLEGNAGYTFDFLPAPDVELDPAWSGSSTPAVTGIYSGPANDTLTFTVIGDGEIGVTDGLSVEVRNGAGELVTTLEVGNGYPAGDRVEIGEGLHVTFDLGTLADGEQFTVEALAESDPSGFLAAAGVGTLLSGTGAATMTVRQEVLDDPRRLATAMGEGMGDNTVARRLAALDETALAELDGATPTDALRLLITDVGQKVAIRQARHDAVQSVVHQLENQRSAVSGVDINEEAAKLLVFEKMFQAMAKVLDTQQQAMDTLIELL